MTQEAVRTTRRATSRWSASWSARWGGLTFLSRHFVCRSALAVLLSMAATVLTTGAFHEDGFADACRRLRRRLDKPQVLAIMKDSRIGSYAAIGRWPAAAGEVECAGLNRCCLRAACWRRRWSPATPCRAWPRPC
jgi:hypothetical protein